MLFHEDLFSRRWIAEHKEARVSEIKDALSLSLEFIASKNWADALDLIKDFVSKSLADKTLGAIQQTLLAVAAFCESQLAIEEGNWSLASDWLFTAMVRCDPENDPLIEERHSIPYQYLLICAAMASDERVLSYEPSQLHVQLSEPAFYNLCLGYVRLSTFNEARLNQSVAGVENLRNRIKECLQQHFIDSDSKRRRGETNIVELVYQQTSSFLRNVQSDAQHILQLNSLSNVQEVSPQFIKIIAQGKKFLLSEEVALLEPLRGILGSLAKLLKAHESNDPIKVNLESQTFNSYLESTLARFENSGLLASTFYLPIIRHLQDLAVQTANIFASEVVPSVILEQTKKRYPIDNIGEIIRLQLEVVNEGKGAATGCKISLEVPDGEKLDLIDPMPIEAETVPPGRSKNLQCRLCLNATFDAVSIPILVEYSDILGNYFSKREVLVIERQRDEPNWDVLMDSAPYELRPVTSVERLRGRTTELNTLKVNAISSSTVLWGQKRVGKTSIAQVFGQEMSTRNNYLTIYIRRGDIAGYSEGKIARVVASRIAQLVPHLRLDIPDETWFGPNFTRLTEWIEEARIRGLSQRLVIIFDEFDEINSAIYLGQRGDNFFSTLRSLSEREVVWIFVGGERMPAIFERHHATLNQVEVYRVDRISNPRDLEDMVVNPVRGQIDWDKEAIELVRNLTAGNPYFVQLICRRVLKEMYSDHRTFVDRSDVSFAAESIVTEDTPSHWGHFWEDNSEIEEDERFVKSSMAALFLATLGEVFKKKDSHRANLSEIIEVAKSFDIEEKDLGQLSHTAIVLVRRGVVQETSIANEKYYQTTVPIFGSFLSKHGSSVVLPFYGRYKDNIQQKVLRNTPPARLPAVIGQSDPFPIDEEELIAISEGLIYQSQRVDPVHIKTWLRQFSNDADILIAAKLLRRLKERYYIDSAHIRHAIDIAFKWLQERMRISGQNLMMAGAGGRVVKEGGRVVNVHVAYYGSASKSGADVAREFKTQKRFSRCSSIDDALNWVTKDRSVSEDKKFILIVDDFVGSGEQAKGELLKAANKIRRDTTLLEFAKQGRVLFSPLWAFADGIDIIKDEVGDIITIQPSHTLDDEDRAFSENSSLYADNDERLYAEAVFRHIGEQLQRQNPLGHDNCQALIVFESTVPNNTLPAFWSSGVVDEKNWRPLFQRP